MAVLFPDESVAYHAFMRSRMPAAMITALWLIAATGCAGPTIHPTFDSPEPAARNAAIVRAASERDQSAIPDLVRMLESDDPATRLLAISTLERLTGETHGYRASDRHSDRRAAVARWRQAIGVDIVPTPSGAPAVPGAGQPSPASGLESPHMLSR